MLPIQTNGKCSITGMIATGIPTNIILNQKLNEALDSCNNMAKKLKETEDKLMDEMPEKIVSTIKKNVDIQGMQQMTKDELTVLLENRDKNLLAELKTIGNINTSNSNSSITNESASNIADITSNGYIAYHWGNKMFRAVPEDFSFPTGNCKSICDLFVTGITDHTGKLIIRPFRLIESKDFKKADKSYFDKAKYVFNQVLRVYKELNDIDLEIGNMTLNQWDNAWNQVFCKFIADIQTLRNKQIGKPNDLTYITMYDMLKEVISGVFRIKHIGSKRKSRTMHIDQESDDSE